MNNIISKFDSRPMTGSEAAVSMAIRGQFAELAMHIEELIPDCREKSIVMTKLEEASMWASKAIINAPKTPSTHE